MARDPFSFLDAGGQERKLLLLLLAIIRRSEAEMLEISLQDLLAVDPGDSFTKAPGCSATSLVLRYARKGAEVYFLQEAESSRTSPSPTRAVARPLAPQPDIPTSPTPLHRSVMHDDLDYALQEEEMAQRMREAARKRNMEARAQDGTLPWRTVKPQ